MKPESTLIKHVHNLLHPDVYREKMFNPMRGGTPDCYYMGYADDLWVEYKWVKKLGPKPAISPLQAAWLIRAWDRGRRPWVVVGSPAGCVVLREPQLWLARVTDQPISRNQLAQEIELRCGLEHLPAQHSPAGTSTPSSS